MLMCVGASGVIDLDGVNEDPQSILERYKKKTLIEVEEHFRPVFGAV